MINMISAPIHKKRDKPITFIVGCSRSGTTVLHASLSKSPLIFTLPETQLPIDLLEGNRWRSFGWNAPNPFRELVYYAASQCGLTSSSRASLTFRQFKEQTNPNLRVRKFFLLGCFLRDVFQEYNQLIRNAAQNKLFVEKSPRNIYCVNEIEKYLKNVRFVHIVRDGHDNIASLVDAGRKYKDFQDRFGSAAYEKRAISYWKRAIRISQLKQGKSNHLIVNYDALTQRPHYTLRRVCDFLEVPFKNEMLSYDPSIVIKPHEIWKIGKRKIQKSESKFKNVFTKEEQQRITKAIRSLNAWVQRVGLDL